MDVDAPAVADEATICLSLHGRTSTSSCVGGGDSDSSVDAVEPFSRRHGSPPPPNPGAAGVGAPLLGRLMCSDRSGDGAASINRSNPGGTIGFLARACAAGMEGSWCSWEVSCLFDLLVCCGMWCLFFSPICVYKFLPPEPLTLSCFPSLSPLSFSLERYQQGGWNGIWCLALSWLGIGIKRASD
jgi:hypothetical protein